MAEIDERVVLPDSRTQLFATDQFAGPFEQNSQHLEWLSRKLDADAFASKFKRLQIRFERSKANSISFIACHRYVPLQKPGSYSLGMEESSAEILFLLNYLASETEEIEKG